MKSFNVNASRLIIEFTCEETNEPIVLDIDEMPLPNYNSDFIGDSENSTDQEFDFENGHSYRVVVYKNTAEGNVEVFDITDDEFEIEEFIVNEEFDEENEDN